MPELPPPKRRPPPELLAKTSLAGPPGEVGASCDDPPSVPYAELRCRTNYSFLEGASHPDELVQRAAALGYSALAITDRNSLAGVVRAHAAAKETGLKLLIGAEVTPVDAPTAVLLAIDRAGYGRLSRLLTLGRRRAPKGDCRLMFDDVASHAAGLLACVPLAPLTSTGTAPSEPSSHESPLRAWRDAFGDRCYGLAELHLGPDDERALLRMSELAAAVDLPLAAANDVHYHEPDRRFLHDVLTAIRHGCTVADLGDRRFPNAARHLKSPGTMAGLFAQRPDAVARTVEIASRCAFSLGELRYEYPEELSPPGTTPLEFLNRLTWDGAARRYPAGLPDKVRRLLEHELRLIEELRYEAYFLTVWDLVRFARGRGILCQGRGSAANSAVCFCLEVTSVDPDRIDVLFERFLSKERDEAPDIDVDFEHERREEVIQYLYEKYGRERAGLAAAVITYRGRSAARDVGKALGLSLDRVDRLSESLGRGHDEDHVARGLREAGLNPTSTLGRQLVALVTQIQGFPRHLSQHTGGMVVTRGPLCELVPIENAAMADRTVIEWDKDDLEALGLLKVDVLALGMLTAIRKAFDLIDRHHNRKLTLANVPSEDPAVYSMISRADTVGVFQIESRAQMSMLPRLRPACFYDLVVEVAIVRPGPIQGKMVHPYLRRRNGEEPIVFPDERIRDVLAKTLGVPLFQEQAMRLVVVAAGFTPGEADQLRRAMGAWRKTGVIEQFRQKLVDGMTSNGYSAEFAGQLFDQIRGFGEYGFPESHAASFALLVYVSAWIKHHYPAAFAAALLNSQPMGFYAPAQLVADARKHGVTVRPIDVSHSAWDCTLEDADPSHGASLDDVPSEDGASADSPALRLGLRMIRGLSQAAAERIVACRSDQPFASLDDCARRAGLSGALLKRLSQADAFQSLGLNRRSALWESLPEREPSPLFDALPAEEPAVALPAVPPGHEILSDYRTVGLSLRGHPMQLIRAMLEKRRVVPAAALATLAPDKRYRVAGLVLLRQRPSTAKGITFVTLEDETGQANLIVRPEVWERNHRVAQHATAMIAHGRLQRENNIIHLLIDRLEDLNELAGVDQPARNFH